MAQMCVSLVKKVIVHVRETLKEHVACLVRIHTTTYVRITLMAAQVILVIEIGSLSKAY